MFQLILGQGLECMGLNMLGDIRCMFAVGWQIILIMHYSFHSTPTTTFKGRSQTITYANQPSYNPGPSQYHGQAVLHKAPTYAHTQQTRNLYKTPQAYPGPGTYEAKSYTTQGQKRSMSAKHINYNKHSPGPADYKNAPPQILNKSPVYTMGNKSKSAKQIIQGHNQYQPGPTQYQPKKAQDKSRTVVLTTGNRHPLTETETTPAPNYYQSQHAKDYTSSKQPRCKVGAQVRKTTGFMKGEPSPGPAGYESKSWVESNADKKKGFSCRQKITNLIAEELAKNPAPGMYQSHLKNKHQAPRPSTTRTQRKTFMDDMQDFKSSYPGPGVHSPNMSGTKYRASSANSFGRTKRRPLDENERTPGPVGYASDKLIVMNKAPGYSSTKNIAKNEFLGVNPQNPGPGQYQPRESLVRPRSTINEVGRQKRPDFDKHKYTPGPGFYNLRGKEQGPTWKFTTERRVSFTDNKSDAKDGAHYQITSRVVDPPSYMHVTSKIQYSPNKSMGATGFSRV